MDSSSSSSLPESGSGDSSSLQPYSVSTKQTEEMETISTEFPSQGLLSRVQIPHFDKAADLRSQNFLSPGNPFIGMESMMNNARSELFTLPVKRKASMESMPHNPTLQQNKHFAQGEHRPWLQQVSGPNKKPMQTHNPVPQLSPVTNKKIVRMEPGTKRSLTAKNQSAKVNPSAKFARESNESVRLKMRESLTASLALVTQQKDEALDAGKDVREQESSQHTGLTCSGIDTVGEVSEKPRGNVRFGEISSASQQEDMGETTSKKTLAAADTGEAQISEYDGSEFQPNVFHYDMSFDDNFFVKDELLQGNGLSWVLDCDMEVVENKEIQSSEKENPEFQVADKGQGEATIQSPETLAFEIEAELFKLFGGVNKKYKEKGRSLLFNLKDRNNPELRERVLYGDISPEQLCSMSVEELASKELSQWRTAKAEELAKMVVLTESDVDIRRLVKKTHKGEVQVEVEDVDSASAEVSIGANSSTQNEPNNTEMEGSLVRKANEMKEEHNVSDHRTDLEDKNAAYTVTIPSNEGTDLMQGLDDDSLKDTEFLPPIVSLDEFMQSLESELLFENVPVDARKRHVPEKADSRTVPDTKNSDPKPKDCIDEVPHEKKKAKEADRKSGDDENSRVRHTEVKSDDNPGEAKSKGDLADLGSVEIRADMKTNDGNDVKSETAPLASAFEIEHFWGGVVQLNTSTMISVVGIFKSGEKTSVKEWPILLEVKGRVRLEAFEKFLQELPMSRTRTLMVLHFDLKEGYPKSDCANLREVAESYVMDERVGLAEPVSGMELYFCPPHRRIIEMLAKILPKEQVEELYNTIDKGLIGVVIWRRKAYLSSSPNSSKRHNSIRQRPSSRKQHETKINADSIPKKTTLSRYLPQPNSGDRKDDDDADDIPPGFGPGLGSGHGPTRDEDDLPEFSFTGGDINPSHTSTRKSSHGPQVSSFNTPDQTQSRPVEHIRELIHKYGQTQSVASPSRGPSGVFVQPWNDDDDDDIPEWTPQQPGQHQQPITLRPHQLVNQQQHHSATTFKSLQVPNSMPLWRQGTQPDSDRFYASRHPGKPQRQYNPRS